MPDGPMREYVEACRVLPVPSQKQMRNFVDHVARAHSWYKHLPLIPPGSHFCFFLDPNSGCDLVIARGKTRYRQRRKRGFHYSDLPTRHYRKSFGYLEYSTRSGTTVLFPDSEGRVPSTRLTAQVSGGKKSGPRSSFDDDLDDLLDAMEKAEARGPRILSREQKWLDVPLEILDVGRVQVTGVIHPIASASWVWNWAWENWSRKRQSDLRWPEETGGSEVLRKILKIAERDPGEKNFNHEGVFGFQPEIHALVDLERQRQKKLMEDCIRRVINLIYS